MVDSPDIQIGGDVGVLKYKGVFDLVGMLRLLRSYVKSHHFDFYETLHKSKMPELELNWECERKVTGYYKYILTYNLHFYDLHQVEVDVGNGQKKKMYDGRFIVTFDGGVKRDFGGSWNVDTSFKEKLQKFYHTITVREYKAFHVAKVVALQRGAMKEMKKFLGMEGV